MNATLTAAQVTYFKIDADEIEAYTPAGTFYLTRDADGWHITIEVDGEVIHGGPVYNTLVQAKAGLTKLADAELALREDDAPEAAEVPVVDDAEIAAAVDQLVAELNPAPNVAVTTPAVDDGLFAYLTPADDGGLFGFSGMRLTEGTPETGFQLVF